MKKITSLILALVMCMSLCATAFASNNGDWNYTGADESIDDVAALVTKFSDVKSSDWYYSNVMECAKLGIGQGFEDGKFHPEDQVTSVQFIVMLTRTFYNDKVETAKKTETSSWYAPNVKVAKDTSMSTGLPAVDEYAMNRYNMAMALHNTLTAFHKQCNTTQIKAASANITDWNIIARSYSNYTVPVADCYAAGIITGMEDGKFAGMQNMTRAQACTVIIRMMTRINNYQPGDTDNEAYDDGKSQVEKTPATGTLANGKPVTEANVLEILAKLEKAYPTGTTWGPAGTPNNNTYTTAAQAGIAVGTNNASDEDFGICMKMANAGGVSLYTACGGWACMVSNTIFGVSGAPAREIYSIEDLRPGDILVRYRNGVPSHIAIIARVGIYCGQPAYVTCDGNISGAVNWPTPYSTMNRSLSGSNGYSVRLFTRYPA